MHVVREIKKYGDILVANAMHKIGWTWQNPKRRPTNIEKMVEGLPRCDLDRILMELQRSN